MHSPQVSMLAMWTPGPLEIAVILIIAVLLFSKRLPEIAGGMGASLVEFRKGLKEARDAKEDIAKEVKDAAAPAEHSGEQTT